MVATDVPVSPPRGPTDENGPDSRSSILEERCGVADRQLTDAALRRSEERFALAVAASNDGIWDWDLDSDDMFLSDRAQALYGLEAGPPTRPRGEWLGMVVFHPGDAEGQRQAVTDYLAGRAGAFDGEWRVRQPDGAYRWLRIRGLCVRDKAGRARRMAGSVSDIDARRRAEDALRISEERYALAMTASGDGFADWNIATGEYYPSPRVLKIYGMPPDAKFASRDEFLARIPIHPQDRARWEQENAAFFASDRQRFDTDLRICPRGEIRWVHVTALLLRDASGAPVRWAGALSDITARKEGEEALRRSEERYALAVKAAGDGHTDWIVATDEFYASPRMLEICGFAPNTVFPDRADFIARFPFHPDDRNRVLQTIGAHYASSAERLEVDMRILRHGETRSIHMTVLCSRDATGALVRASSAVTDVTERRSAEAALRESEERFSLAVAGSTDGIWDWNVIADEMFFSKRTQELYGLEPGATVRPRSEWRDMVRLHPDDAPAQLAAVEEYLAGRTPTYDGEWRVRHGDGNYRWIRIRGLCVRDAQERATRMAGSVSDIDSRRRAEAALRESEERYALAVAGSNEGIFDWDLATDQVYISHRAQELFGLRPESPWRSRREWIGSLHYHSDDLDVQRRGIRAHLAGECPAYDAEFRLISGDGRVRWFRQRGVALRDANGKAFRMVGSISDVTERKAAQDELLRMERQLRQAQRLEAMGTLAGGIAHDFNNILGAILGFGEMALRGASRGSRLQRDLDCIMAAGERGRALVDRILAYSRSGMSARIPVHVEHVVREVLDLIAAKRPRAVRVETQLRAGSAAMLADPTQVHQVVMNLATNAIQAMPDGGTLRVALEGTRVGVAREVTTGTVGAGEYVVLTVADSGTGISADIIDRIFDPFFTTKEVGVGTGLGLSLVQGIVGEVGGAIDVRSTVGAGTVFTVYLPRAGDAIAAGDDAAPVLARGDSEQILVVDDERPLVRLATENLRALGYRPVAFTSSSKALAAFRAHPERYDAVVSDQRMPGLSGIELIGAIRAIRPTIPTFLVSGFVGGDLLSRAREAGADEVLKKPLSLRDLAANLARVLAGRAADAKRDQPAAVAAPVASSSSAAATPQRATRRRGRTAARA